MRTLNQTPTKWLSQFSADNNVILGTNSVCFVFLHFANFKYYFFLSQVGLFFCRGPITYLDAKFNGKTTLIVVGDKMGNVEFLDFTL